MMMIMMMVTVILAYSMTHCAKKLIIPDINIPKLLNGLPSKTIRAESSFFILLHHFHRAPLTSALFFGEGGKEEAVGFTHDTEPT